MRNLARMHSRILCNNAAPHRISHQGHSIGNLLISQQLAQLTRKKRYILRTTWRIRKPAPVQIITQNTVTLRCQKRGHTIPNDRRCGQAMHGHNHRTINRNMPLIMGHTSRQLGKRSLGTIPHRRINNAALCLKHKRQRGNQRCDHCDKKPNHGLGTMDHWKPICPQALTVLHVMARKWRRRAPRAGDITGIITDPTQ